MKMILAAMAVALPQWIAVVPVYPDPAMFDPQVTIDQCSLFGSMAGAVQIARRDTGDDLGTFLIRMPQELRADNNGHKQPVIEAYYLKIGTWTYENYSQDDDVDMIMHDYTKKCIEQSSPSNMEEWWRMKEREQIPEGIGV